MFKVGQKVKRKYYDPINGYQYTECTIIELKKNYCLVTHNNRKQKNKSTLQPLINLRGFFIL